MPGYLSGDLTVLIYGGASMLSASIRKLFHQSMFADFISRNVPETVIAQNNNATYSDQRT